MKIRRLFGFLRRSPQDIDADVDEELRFHLDQRADALVAGGLSTNAARAQALREFGDLEDARAYMRALDRDIETRQRRKDYMGELTQDLAFAVRKLRSSPGFAIVAVLTLALGIGANTAIFSIVNGVLLRPLDFPHAEQLVNVWWADRPAGYLHTPLSAVDLDDWRAQRTDFSSVSGYWYAEGTSGIDLTGGKEAQRLSAAFVERDFFSTLGVNADHGRLPRPEELVRGGPIRVVVLSHGFWVRQFGASRSVIDSTLTLSGAPYAVIGVLPPSFHYPAPNVDVYVPFATIPDDAAPRIRWNRFLSGFARLERGVTPAQAQLQANGVAHRLSKQFVEDSSYDGATVQSMKAAMTGPVRSSLLVLLGTVALVLLLACVNLASLQLARGAGRAHEVAVRMSLGATGGRIARQMLTESLVLATIGGAAGLGFGILGTRALVALAAGQIPRASDVSVDGTVLLFTLALSLATGVLFGLAPALRISAGTLQQSLREGGRSMAGVAGHRLRGGLVVFEIALALVLAAGACLMAESFVRLMRVDAGFRPDHLVAVNFTISPSQWTDSAGYRGFYRRVIDAARTLPGVVSAGAAQYAPFQGLGERGSFRPQGMTVAPDGQLPTMYVERVSDGYFHTVGTPMVAGREFTAAEDAKSPPGVIVNKTLADRYFGGNAMGKTLDFGAPPAIPIIGVVGDIRQSALDEPAPPIVYVNNMRSPRVRTTLVLRTGGNPMTTARNMRALIQSMAPDQPVTSVLTFDQLLSDEVARPRALTTLLAAFGAIGLILGALGIYGVLAYLVSQRGREIGVRMALGAGRGSVLRMIVRRGVMLAVIGVAIGLPAAIAFAHLIRGVLFGVEPGDPVNFALVAAALLLVAAAASYLPARRAARVDPAIALRNE
jgi:putative ABC transport system permease protein